VVHAGGDKGAGCCALSSGGSGGCVKSGGSTAVEAAG
jgi:hypothetical protein